MTMSACPMVCAVHDDPAENVRPAAAEAMAANFPYSNKTNFRIALE